MLVRLCKRYLSGHGLRVWSIALALLALCCGLCLSEASSAHAARSPYVMRDQAELAPHARYIAVSDISGGEDPSGRPETTSTATPNSNSVLATTPKGWEALALGDLAQALGWPPIVRNDTSGRLSIQRAASVDEWSVATIRPFDFSAGAAAAFAAEQEDARLAGYQVTSEALASYPAFWVSVSDSSGRVIERRFHVLADTWIMGVDVHETGAFAPDPRSVASQLVTISLQYGLSTPTAGHPTTVVPTPRSVPAGTSVPPGCGASFYDVPSNDWASSYIAHLACKGIVTGYSDGAFKPLNSTTRAQLAKMLVLSEGWTLVSPSTPDFVDVGVDHIFYRYVETAYSHGVITGYSNGAFRPDDHVTRAQVAKMLVVARRWPLLVDAPVNLCDVLISNWAWDYIQVAIAHGVFTGYGDGCFYPDALATRAQLAKVLVLAYR